MPLYLDANNALAGIERLFKLTDVNVRTQFHSLSLVSFVLQDSVKFSHNSIISLSQSQYGIQQFIEWFRNQDQLRLENDLYFPLKWGISFVLLAKETVCPWITFTEYHMPRTEEKFSKFIKEICLKPIFQMEITQMIKI